jgi:hypothetical protein
MEKTGNMLNSLNKHVSRRGNQKLQMNGFPGPMLKGIFSDFF